MNQQILASEAGLRGLSVLADVSERTIGWGGVEAVCQSRGEPVGFKGVFRLRVRGAGAVGCLPLVLRQDLTVAHHCDFNRFAQPNI